MAPVPSFPWISIPSFAQPGQVHAFADREEHLAQLYKALVAAGNAVRAGQSGVRHRLVVSGYKGVGKSALILQVLGMIRDETGVTDGGIVELPPGLPEPSDRQRWLILRASGKQVASVDALADDLRKSVLSVLDDVHQEAARAVPSALELPLLHRLFSKEAQLFSEVRAALSTLALTIEYVRRWEGAQVKESLSTTDQVESSRNTEVQLDNLLKAQGEYAKTAAAQGALKIAAGFLRKWGATSRASSTAERQLVVGADLVVEALNAFFAATDRAGVPTLLVLDDFDEFASSVGPSHQERSKVLSVIVGAFSQLRPTALVIGLREEYLHEDILRQYRNVSVPPMTRRAAADALNAWGRVQQPPLSPETEAALRQLAERFLSRFPADEAVVIPFTFFQVVAFLANNASGSDESDHELLLRYVRGVFSIDVQRAVKRVAAAMPLDDVALAAGAAPLDPSAYSLSDRERLSLERAGLLRPAMAGDPGDNRIVLDPLFAYLRASQGA